MRCVTIPVASLYGETSINFKFSYSVFGDAKLKFRNGEYCKEISCKVTINGHNNYATTMFYIIGTSPCQSNPAKPTRFKPTYDNKKTMEFADETKMRFLNAMSVGGGEGFCFDGEVRILLVCYLAGLDSA